MRELKGEANVLVVILMVLNVRADRGRQRPTAVAFAVIVTVVFISSSSQQEVSGVLRAISMLCEKF